MRYFIDTEFVDTGSLIDLISIGIVAEDGRELYLQSCEFNHRNASQWVKDNVLKHLLMCPLGESAKQGIPGLYRADRAYHRKYGGQCVDQQRGPLHNCLWRTREQIAREIRIFCDPEKYGTPELWGWCAGYDFVVLCQLFGTMMDLPAGFPHYIRDLQYLLDERGLTDEMLPPQTEIAHNALADARYLKLLWEWLTVTGATAPRWVLNKQDYEHLRSGPWLSDVKPLMLKNDPGVKFTGGIIPPGALAMAEESAPTSELVYGGEAGATIFPSKVGGQREGKTHVHIRLDNEEIKPEDCKLRGYVDHEGLLTTGGDSGQELVIEWLDEETKVETNEDA